MPTYKKLTINMSEEVHADLSALAGERGITITELIKRAVALDKYVWENRDAELLMKRGDEVVKLTQVVEF